MAISSTRDKGTCRSTNIDIIMRRQRVPSPIIFTAKHTRRRAGLTARIKSSTQPNEHPPSAKPITASLLHWLSIVPTQAVCVSGTPCLMVHSPSFSLDCVLKSPLIPFPSSFSFLPLPWIPLLFYNIYFVTLSSHTLYTPLQHSTIPGPAF
jgi:hypothetical protein